MSSVLIKPAQKHASEREPLFGKFLLPIVWVVAIPFLLPILLMKVGCLLENQTKMR